MSAVLFRCDGGPELGIGHVMRCSALAAAFGALGWRSAFAVTRESAPLVSGREVVIVPPGREGASVVAATCSAEDFEILVVDHYGLDAAFEGAARGAAALVVVIDDLADRAHDCDVLLDPNPERAPADYDRLVSRETRLLLGLKHASLRAEFHERDRKSVV